MLPALERQLYWTQLLYTSKTAELRRGTVILSREVRERAGEITAWAQTASVEDQRRMVAALWEWRKLGRWRMPSLIEMIRAKGD
jgi:hypothetical protein